MLNTWYQRFEKALDPEFCKFIVDHTDWESGEQSTVLKEGQPVDKSERNSRHVWLPTNSPMGCIAQTYIGIANNIWQYQLSRIEKVQMTEYPVDGHYDWHMDSFSPDQFGQQRKLSISMLLNEDFEGGGLEIDGEKVENVLKYAGDIVVFPSFLKHRVIPITKGTRFTAVSWAYGPSFR